MDLQQEHELATLGMVEETDSHQVVPLQVVVAGSQHLGQTETSPGDTRELTGKVDLGERAVDGHQAKIHRGQQVINIRLQFDIRKWWSFAT